MAVPPTVHIHSGLYSVRASYRGGYQMTSFGLCVYTYVSHKQNWKNKMRNRYQRMPPWDWGREGRAGEREWWIAQESAWRPDLALGQSPKNKCCSFQGHQESPFLVLLCFLVSFWSPWQLTPGRPHRREIALKFSMLCVYHVVERLCLTWERHANFHMLLYTDSKS